MQKYVRISLNSSSLATAEMIDAISAATARHFGVPKDEVRIISAATLLRPANVVEIIVETAEKESKLDLGLTPQIPEGFCQSLADLVSRLTGKQATVLSDPSHTKTLVLQASTKSY